MPFSKSFVKPQFLPLMSEKDEFKLEEVHGNASKMRGNRKAILQGDLLLSKWPHSINTLIG